MNIKKPKLEEPLNYAREKFINAVSDTDDSDFTHERKTHAVTFTLNTRDIEMLESQIDRAIKLGKRNKSKSATIRMALKALCDCSDEIYKKLYDKF